MSKNALLLPTGFRFVGFLFFAFGILTGLVRFYFGIKPEFLEFRVFAVYSSYLQSKMMETISNNLIEEITAFSLITGLFLTAFSREKNEGPEIDQIRLRSFFISSYLNFLFLTGSIFLFFGLAFVYMLMINLGSGLMFYIATFRILHSKYLSRSSTSL